MTCEDVRKALPLYLYGELPFDEEEALESHLDGCESCTAALGRERAMHALFDEQELTPVPMQLREARLRLEAALGRERSRSDWWQHMWASFRMPLVAKPVGAVALVALGFFGAHIIPGGSLPGLRSASLFDPNTARVRYVEPGPSGQVQIVVDETRQRVLSGHLDDANIRGLLLAAVKDPSDPGLRVESVELLKSNSENDDVRTTLINVLRHDTNDGVRLKALEGLKPFVAHQDVRKALSDSLLADQNPSIRAQAIDLLMSHTQEQQLVGVLQELMHKEENTYIRGRCEKALHSMKASAESY